MSHIPKLPGHCACVNVYQYPEIIVHAFEVRKPVLNEGVIVMKESISVLVITIKSKVRGSFC